MRSKFLEAYNALNLIRNGGMDFIGSGVPPFWEIGGATFAGGGVNNVTVIQGETPASVHAAVNYFRVFAASSTPVVFRHEVAKRFIQMAFTDELFTPNGDRNSNTFDDSRVPRGYDKINLCQLLRGEMTVAWSVRVVGGAAKITVRVVKTQTGDKVESVAYPALASKDWVRPKYCFDADTYAVQALEFVVEKIRGEVAEVHLGAFMASSGYYDQLPFTGDMMADAIPKDAIVFAVGDACPPGFEKIVLSGVPSKGRAFIKADPTTDLSVTGSESHAHEDLVVKMEPELNWPGVAVENGWGLSMAESPRTSIKYPADLAWKAHTHPIGPAEALPSSRDIILCKRL